MVKSLRDLSAETIIRSLNSYGDEISRRLSPRVRDMVLQKLLTDSKTCGGKKFVDVWPNLHSLFSFATKCIDTISLTNIVSNIHDRYTNDQLLMQALEMIASNAPDLKELIFSSPYPMQYRLQPMEVSMICKMKNLTHLSFNNPSVPVVTMIVDDMMTITRECKNLQSITAYFSSEKEVAFLSEQIFPYQAINVIDPINKEKSVTLFKILPRNLIGPYFCWSAYLYDDQSLIFLKDALTRHSNTDVKSDAVPRKVDEVMLYNKLKSVKFICERYTPAILTRFLIENGQNLDELRILPIRYNEENKIPLNVTLAQVFNWCSNLSVFEMRSFQVTSFDVPATALTRLRKFTWACNSETRGFRLSSILSAPLLEEVEIEDYQLKIGQNDDLLDRIEKRKILQNLKKFVFYDLSYPPCPERVHLLYTLKCAIPEASVQHFRSYKGLAYHLLKVY